jgi:hypothetical protein
VICPIRSPHAILSENLGTREMGEEKVSGKEKMYR